MLAKKWPHNIRWTYTIYRFLKSSPKGSQEDPVGKTIIVTSLVYCFKILVKIVRPCKGKRLNQRSSPCKILAQGLAKRQDDNTLTSATFFSFFLCRACVLHAPSEWDQRYMWLDLVHFSYSNLTIPFVSY